MLVIRLQRTGRKGHAMFRVVVQDSRRTPSSGKVIAWLGSYDPHAKNFQVDKEKAAFYLEHGAQPSPRMAALLKADGVKLPKWVALKPESNKAVRNPDKRRSTRPAEEVAPEKVPTSEAPETEAEVTEAPTEASEPEAPEAATEAGPEIEASAEETKETIEKEASES